MKTKNRLDDCERICAKIGLETLADINLFCKRERQGNETRIETLRRYEKEFDGVEILKGETK